MAASITMKSCGSTRPPPKLPSWNTLSTVAGVIPAVTQIADISAASDMVACPSALCTSCTCSSVGGTTSSRLCDICARFAK